MTNEEAVWKLFNDWESAELALFSEFGVGGLEQHELDRQIKERRLLIERLFGPETGSP